MKGSRRHSVEGNMNMDVQRKDVTEILMYGIPERHGNGMMMHSPLLQL